MGSQASPVMVPLGLRYRTEKHLFVINSDYNQAFGIISQPGWMGSQASPVMVPLGLRYRPKKHLFGINSKKESISIWD